ncbi:hypothetical protein EI94DRAFT_1757742 [Lactarius quietus]|nr:hypothetical protein EI94DRAFT_1757742 [Lactarius quietus]
MAMAAGSTKVTLLGNMRERPRLIPTLYLSPHFACAHSPSRQCRRLITLCRRFQHTTSSPHLAEHDVPTAYARCSSLPSAKHVSLTSAVSVSPPPASSLYVPYAPFGATFPHAKPSCACSSLILLPSTVAWTSVTAPGTHWGVRDFINDGKVKDGGDWDELTLFLA